MSENESHFQSNFSTNEDGLKNRGWTKDRCGLQPQTKGTALGLRSVLAPITNKPVERITHPAKKNGGGIKDQNEAVQEALSTIFNTAPCYSTSMDHDMNEQAVDLSCHEINTDGLRSRLRHDSTQMDSQDSLTLLDMSNSGDISIEDCISDEEDDDDLKQRVDKLLSMAEYTEEIYHYLRKAELLHRPKPNYMRRQSDITLNMRSILVDWLVEVADEYKLHRETLFLAVDYVDRFLSVMAVQRQKLQLVGAAAMFIAAKYEEIYPPEVGEFVYITDDTYTKQQVLRMESLILKVLSFDVAVPTIHLFCERFLKELKASSKTSSLAMYLTELSLVDGDTYLQYLPSVTACAAICLARYTLGEEPWSRQCMSVTQYKMADFECCLRDLLVTFNAAATHPQQAIQGKYRQSAYYEVSSLQPPHSLPQTTN